MPDEIVLTKKTSISLGLVILLIGGVIGLIMNSTSSAQTHKDAIYKIESESKDRYNEVLRLVEKNAYAIGSIIEQQKKNTGDIEKLKEK